MGRKRRAFSRASLSPMPTRDEVLTALQSVLDPEIGKPITELDMVKNVTVDGGNVIVEVLLTVAGCPLKDKITRDVTNAVQPLDGVSHVEVVLGVMTDDQRQSMVAKLRAGQPKGADRPIAFWQEGSTTRAILVASGKGGVGKSSLTANLAVSLAQQGYKVGVVDVDVWGFSQARMLGVHGRPTAFEGMALPLEGHGVKVISMGFLVPDEQPVIWRGPMLHKIVNQFLADVYWGDVDFILADLPPGTGDVLISIAQYLPGAELLIVTTPQDAAAKVAARAGKSTDQVNLRLLGVVENMSYFECPSCSDKHRIFGEGGGKQLAESLGTKLLAEVPIDLGLREGADEGKPIVITNPDSPAAKAIRDLAKTIGGSGPSLVGKRLPLAVTPGAPAGGHAHQH
jgi:ATP-binding protein involved in chromosome partitioning